MVNKLPDHSECPVDYCLLSFIDTHLHWYYQAGFTPNMVTTLSILLGIGAAYAVQQQSYAWGALLFALAYYLDCVDGKLARRFNMVTMFGDYYDHFGDLFKFSLMLYVLYQNRQRPLSAVQQYFKYGVWFLTVMLMVHIGYSETLYPGEESVTLAPFKALVQLDTEPHRTIQWTKHFGNGTLILFVVTGILLWDYYKVGRRNG